MKSPQNLKRKFSLWIRANISKISDLLSFTKKPEIIYSCLFIIALMASIFILSPHEIDTVYSTEYLFHIQKVSGEEIKKLFVDTYYYDGANPWVTFQIQLNPDKSKQSKPFSLVLSLPHPVEINPAELEANKHNNIIAKIIKTSQKYDDLEIVIPSPEKKNYSTELSFPLLRNYSEFKYLIPVAISSMSIIKFPVIFIFTPLTSTDMSWDGAPPDQMSTSYVWNDVTRLFKRTHIKIYSQELWRKTEYRKIIGTIIMSFALSCFSNYLFYYFSKKKRAKLTP